MKHFHRFLLCFVAICALALPSRAVFIPDYPGLDKLIESADVIALVRVEGRIESKSRSYPLTGLETRSCMVYQALKGELPTDQTHRTEITLNHFVNFGGVPVASDRLVFLRHSDKSDASSNYVTLGIQGAMLSLSPLGNETKPEGDTSKAQIQTLIRRYQTYRAAQIKREDEILDAALTE